MNIIDNTTPEGSIINLHIDQGNLVRTGFMNKYNLLVDTVIYHAYLNTTTNQLCFQQESGNLCFNFSLTGLPDVDINNATSGQVLMYNGTSWVNSNINSILNYERNTQSTRFSDILSVSSVQDALDQILYPYANPTFPTFLIQGKPTTLELGQSLSNTSGGFQTFQWTTTNLTNISNTNGYSILDVTNLYTLGTNILPKSLTSTSLNIPYGIKYTTNGAVNTFRISGKNTKGIFFQKDATFTWKPKIFWGTNLQSSALNSAQILALPSSPTGGSNLVSTPVNSFLMNGNGEYIWICYPSSFGKMIQNDGSLSRFFVGGLSNSFWNIFTVNFTNQYGYTSQYYLYRSSVPSFGTNISISIV